jgi:hypothetical protein
MASRLNSVDQVHKSAEENKRFENVHRNNLAVKAAIGMSSAYKVVLEKMDKLDKSTSNSVGQYSLASYFIKTGNAVLGGFKHVEAGKLLETVQDKNLSTFQKIGMTCKNVASKFDWSSVAAGGIYAGKGVAITGIVGAVAGGAVPMAAGLLTYAAMVALSKPKGVQFEHNVGHLLQNTVNAFSIKNARRIMKGQLPEFGHGHGHDHSHGHGHDHVHDNAHGHDHHVAPKGNMFVRDVKEAYDITKNVVHGIKDTFDHRREIGAQIREAIKNPKTILMNQNKSDMDLHVKNREQMENKISQHMDGLNSIQIDRSALVNERLQEIARESMTICYKDGGSQMAPEPVLGQTVKLSTTRNSFAKAM